MKKLKIFNISLFSICFILFFHFSSKANKENIINANNQFTFRLHPKINEKLDNIFFSPFNISADPGITYEVTREKQLGYYLPDKVYNPEK